MPVQDERDNVGWKPHEQSAIQTPAQTPSYERVPTVPTNENAEQNKPIAVKLEQEIKSGERWLIGIGIATLLINTGIGLIYWGQLKEMRHTNALTTQALSGSDDTLKKTLQKLQGQIDQTSRLARATEKANLNALTTDRPWVGGWIQVQGFSPNSAPTAVCSFQNSGRRPALMDSSTCAVYMVPGQHLPDDPVKPGKGILLPNQTTTAAVVFIGGGRLPLIQDKRITPFFIDEANAGRITIKVIGEAFYKDIRTGTPHHTKICVRYLPSSYGRPAGFYSCDDDREAN